MDEQADRERLLADLSSAFALHAKRRLISALFVVVGSALVVGAGLSWLSDNLLLSIIAALVFGLLLLNLAIVFVVPPADRANAARDLIYDAACEPSRIKVFDMEHVQILDAEGSIHHLRGFNQGAWRAYVVPYFIKQIMRAEKEGVLPTAGRKMTSSERRYVEGLSRELAKTRKEVDEKTRLLNERERELGQREQELDEREEWIRVQVDRGKTGHGD